jgi:addiction module HigA family antidote
VISAGHHGSAVQVNHHLQLSQKNRYGCKINAPAARASGEILRDEFLKPMDISVYELANAIKVPRTRTNDIIHGRRAITVDAAIRLGRYFGTSPEFWINLQARYDLDIADRTLRRRIEKEVSPRAA